MCFILLNLESTCKKKCNVCVSESGLLCLTWSPSSSISFLASDKIPVFIMAEYSSAMYLCYILFIYPPADGYSFIGYWEQYCNRHGSTHTNPCHMLSSFTFSIYQGWYSSIIIVIFKKKKNSHTGIHCYRQFLSLAVHTDSFYPLFSPVSFLPFLMTDSHCDWSRTDSTLLMSISLIFPFN